MGEILPVNFQKMKNGSHYPFMYKVSRLLESKNMPASGFEQHIAAFNLALRAEEAAMKVRRKSELTLELGKLNELRMELYTGMLYHIESSLRHYDPALRNAAKSVTYTIKSVAFMHNKASVEKKVHMSKVTYNLRNPKNAGAVEILQLEGWMDALDVANDNYQRIWLARVNQKANQGNGNVRLARVDTDKAYKSIIKLLNALILINGPEEYSPFIKMLNVYISHANKSIAIRRGWRKRKKELKEKEKETSVS